MNLLLCLAKLIGRAAPVCLILTSFAAPAQEFDPQEDPLTVEDLDRAEQTIELLMPLLELEDNLEGQISEFDQTELDAEDVPVELQRLMTELQSVQEQISVVVTGVSERSYQGYDNANFDLNVEVQNLVEPFVILLNEATSDARQLERSRRNLGVANRRLADAETAISNIEAALSQNSDPAITERLQANLELWQNRMTQLKTQVEALTQRVQDLQSNRVNVGRNVNDAFQVFFKDRSVSLVMGLAAFFGVLFLSRFLLFVGKKLLSRRKKEKTLTMRLVGVFLSLSSIIASFAAMLIVFNLRNDWLLLGLATFLSFAAIWITLKMLPSLLEQLWVLLNLGAVQERERVLFNGVPFRVERLSFFTDLVNPALDGGEFTLPVRELIGMHSRPAAVDEAWFPSRKNDWVKLSDGNSGQVVAQTPEMVVLELLGGAQVTYQTADYLAASPENLTNGYRVEIEFGIGYRHQENAATTVIEKMRNGVMNHFRDLLDETELRQVGVEFLRAGSSSLDYEVEIDIAGSAASRFEELERELARCLVLLANEHEWEIPFQQVVVHGSP